MLPIWVARFIPNLYLSPQGLIMKENREDRLVNDASHLQSFDPICVNMLTLPKKESQLEYGKSFVAHLTQIYDSRITHI